MWGRPRPTGAVISIRGLGASGGSGHAPKSLPNGRQQGGAFGAAPRRRRFAPPPWGLLSSIWRGFLSFWCISGALLDLQGPVGIFILNLIDFFYGFLSRFGVSRVWFLCRPLFLFCIFRFPRLFSGISVLFFLGCSQHGPPR